MSPRLPSLRRAQEREWVGGRYTMPLEVLEDGEVIHPDVILWLELPRGVLVASRALDPRQPVSAAKILEDTMRKPAQGSPRRPTRIRVADDDMATELRRSAAGIPVTVAPVPELDAVFADLCAQLPRDDPGRTYLDGGNTSPAIIKELFDAAGLLFRAAPWRHIAEHQVVRIDIPRFNVEGACLSIIGGVEESLGLLLFRSIPDFLAFGTDATVPEAFAAKDAISLRSLTFDRKKDVPPSMLAEIKQHGWPVVGAKAYPMLICVGGENNPRVPTERDSRIMTACALAFLAFFARHRRLFDDADPAQISDSFAPGDEVTVTVTAPALTAGDGFSIGFGEEGYDDEADDDDDDFDETVPVKRTVGRNDPCPCGSGKKYKKCHLEADKK